MNLRDASHPVFQGPCFLYSSPFSSRFLSSVPMALELELVKADPLYKFTHPLSRQLGHWACFLAPQDLFWFFSVTVISTF